MEDFLGRNMNKKRVIKYILAGLGFVVLAGIGWFAYTVYTLVFWWGLEDRVVGTYRPVIDGIIEYEKQTESLPKDINSLVSKYISEIPKMKEVKSIEYNIIEPNNWQLIVIAKAKGLKKEFIYRTTNKLTAEEEKKLWTDCHGWFVLLH